MYVYILINIHIYTHTHIYIYNKRKQDNMANSKYFDDDRLVVYQP